MAKEDKYKEGVDFVWVDKGGYKTRKFLTRAEKAAKAAPDKPVIAKPKAKAKEFSIDMASKAIEKSKGQPMTSSPRPMARPVDKTPKPVAAPVKISVTPLPMAKTQTTSTGVRPEGKAAGMPQNKSIKHYEGLIKSGVGSASEIRSAKAVLAILRRDAGMPETKIKPTYDTTPAKGRMVVDQKLWNKTAAPKAAKVTGTMTKAMKNYEAILNSSTASASEKRSAKAALAMLKGNE
jgi:hypothetical protein